MAKVTELVTQFKFEGSTAPLKDFNASMGSAIGLLAKGLAGVTAVAGVFNGLAIATLRSSDRLNQLARETGLSVGQLQTLDGVASQLGISFESVTSSVEQLNIKIGEAAQKGSEEFDRLGVSVRNSDGSVKSAMQVMDELRSSFNRLGLSMQERRSFAESLGIDSDSMAMLQLSQKEFAKLRHEAERFGKLSKDQSRQVRDFNREFDNLFFGVGQLSKQMAVMFAPALTDVADKLGNLLAGSKDLILNGVQELVKWMKDGWYWVKAFGQSVSRVAGFVIDAISEMLPFLALLGAAFLAVKVKAIGLKATLAILFAPFMTMTALIAGAILVVDDLIVAFQGGDSVIKKFVESTFGIDITPMLQKAVKMVKEVTKIVWDGFKQVGQMLSLLFKGEFKQVGNMLYDAFADAGRKIMSLFQGIMGYIKELIVGILPDWAKDLVGISTSQQSSAIPPPPSVTNSQNSNTVQQSVNIEIKTDQPQMAGQFVVQDLQAQLAEAQVQNNRGGR